MKKISTLLLIIVLVCGYHGIIACDAGGPGSDSCQYESEVTVLGLTLWRVKGPSVNCDEGEYACCTPTSADCEEEPELAPE